MGANEVENKPARRWCEEGGKVIQLGKQHSHGFFFDVDGVLQLLEDVAEGEGPAVWPAQTCCRPRAPFHPQRNEPPAAAIDENEIGVLVIAGLDTNLLVDTIVRLSSVHAI